MKWMTRAAIHLILIGMGLTVAKHACKDEEPECIDIVVKANLKDTRNIRLPRVYTEPDLRFDWELEEERRSHYLNVWGRYDAHSFYEDVLTEFIESSFLLCANNILDFFPFFGYNVPVTLYMGRSDFLEFKIDLAIGHYQPEEADFCLVLDLCEGRMDVYSDLDGTAYEFSVDLYDSDIEDYLDDFFSPYSGVESIEDQWISELNIGYEIEEYMDDDTYYEGDDDDTLDDDDSLDDDTFVDDDTYYEGDDDDTLDDDDSLDDDTF